MNSSSGASAWVISPRRCASRYLEGLERATVLRIISSASSQLFFFQAEDGIRDYKVTGVQTCALPISATTETYPLFFRLDFWHSAVVHVSAQHRAKEGRQDSPLFQRRGESPAARLQDCAAHSVVSGRD